MNHSSCLWLILRLLVFIAARKYGTEFTNHKVGERAITFLASTKNDVGMKDLPNSNY